MAAQDAEQLGKASEQGLGLGANKSEEVGGVEQREEPSAHEGTPPPPHSHQGSAVASVHVTSQLAGLKRRAAMRRSEA